MPKDTEGHNNSLLEDAEAVPEDTTQEHPERPEPTEPALSIDDIAPTHGPKHSFADWYKTHKKVSIPLTVLLVTVLLAAIPFTRFALAGTILKQDFQLRLVDADNKKPVSSARVTLGGITVTTDAKGIAQLHSAVGSQAAEVSKKYFKSDTFAVTVPILKQKDVPTFSLKATGRQVPIAVVNKISGKPAANIVITSGDAEAKTDKQGKAVLVIPAGQKTLEATFSGTGYNQLKQTLQVTTEEVAGNTVSIVPSGQLYFLSNQSGKIDLVSTNLDGTNRQIVVAGTGKEDRYATTLLASRDWKYLALIAKRDSDKAKVYLVTTANNELTTMDEGDATFEAVGWSGSRFVYKVSRTKQQWEDKRQALKSFDAISKKLTTLDETKTEGTQAGAVTEELQGAYIFGDAVIFAKSWFYGVGYGQLLMQGKQHTLGTVQADGKAKKTIKSYDALCGGTYCSLNIRPYAPDELYILHDSGQNAIVEEYEDGQIKKADITRDDYYNKPYPTYLLSPDGTQTFWTDNRDGNQMLFIGDSTGDNKKQVGSLDQEFTAYGWYTDSYLIVSNKRKALYLLPVAGVQSEDKLLKVSDYYSGPLFNGYGSGYGGQ